LKSGIWPYRISVHFKKSDGCSPFERASASIES
jgi:hypothetical protein